MPITNNMTINKFASILLGACLLICAGTLTSSCKHETTPSEVVLTSFEQLKKGSFSGYLATYDFNEEQADFWQEVYMEKGEASLEERGGIRSFKTVSEDIDREKGIAVVHTAVTFGDGITEDIESTLRYTQDGWKQTIGK